MSNMKMVSLIAAAERRAEVDVEQTASNIAQELDAMSAMIQQQILELHQIAAQLREDVGHLKTFARAQLSPAMKRTDPDAPRKINRDPQPFWKNEPREE